MHLDGFGRRVIEWYLTTFHIFTLLKHDSSSKITELNLVVLSKKDILRSDIMVDDIFLFMKVVDSLSNLQSILLHLLDCHFLAHLASKITIFAVLEYKIEVDFVRKCIL